MCWRRYSRPCGAPDLRRSESKPSVHHPEPRQGVAVERLQITLVLQCKLYSQPVGNSTIQEISAARLHQRADYAAVVSNASFTPAARHLAMTNGVYLLHHEALRVLIR
ncbi:MAG: restriction endonuclease [Janthinobacterium lividum]